MKNKYIKLFLLFFLFLELNASTEMEKDKQKLLVIAEEMNNIDFQKEIDSKRIFLLKNNYKKIIIKN